MGVLIIYIFGEQLVGIFSSDPEVIKYGYLMARIFAAGYLTLPVIQIISGALRGVGLSNIPMYFMVDFCLFKTDLSCNCSTFNS